MIAAGRIAVSLAAICAVVVAVGSIGPWATFGVAFVGSLSANGTDGDGRLTLALAGFAFVVAGVLAVEPGGLRWLAWPLAASFAAAAVVGAFNWLGVGERMPTIAAFGEDVVGERAGWGLHAVTFGGLSGLVFAWLRWRVGSVGTARTQPASARAR